MLNSSSPLLPTYAAKGRFCFVPPRKREEFPRLLRPLRAPSTHCDALRPISAEKPADFSERVHLFFRKSAYFQMGVVRFFFPSHCMLRTAAHFLPLPLAFASHFPHSLALSHAQRRATANSSAEATSCRRISARFYHILRDAKAENDNFETHSREIHPTRYLFSCILIARP